MIPKLLQLIFEDDLQSLVKNGASEGRQLEYKQTLPGTSDGEVKEFLKDVSAMANSAGGDILYDQDDLLLHGVLIEDLEGDVNLLLRDTFDTIWNAAGFDQSLFYDAVGRRVQWIERR